MKPLFSILAILLAFNVVGQSENDHEFKSDEINFDLAKGIYEYAGNVSYKTQILDIENADKIVFNEGTKEIIVSGLTSF